jgi:hypothetical protein
MKMGLRKNFNYKGINIKNSYFRVFNIKGNKNLITFDVICYANQKEAVKGAKNKIFITQAYSFKPNWNSKDNLLKQIYKYLKTLDDFKNSEDC